MFERLYIPRMIENDYEQYMDQAIRQAEYAFELDEVPVGALVVHENRIIGRGHNQTESFHDATAHAEMIALTAAYEHLGDWRLEGCILISTLEPCPMCAGAAMLSRIEKIIYGAKDPKFGACGSVIDIPGQNRFNHHIEVIGGVRAEQVAIMMKSFFQQVRTGKERIN
ncbi:MAG TPA: tRNA adenosine(34) deaminase TadA [candidate division Zixibacteria bacterium]|nr:tRNA adenosine(34) deaminase TadA [candidate division Zixibacteria bacterium]